MNSDNDVSQKNGSTHSMTDRIMLDIETLGTEPGSVILSIGAVAFGPQGVADDRFWSIDRDSCEGHGLTADSETVQWWRDKSDAARQVLDGGEALQPALEELAAFVGDADQVWAHSPKFDAAILEAAFDAIDQPSPWEFWQLRDSRTVMELPIAPDIEMDGVKHDALDDARHQARVVAETLARMEAIEA